MKTELYIALRYTFTQHKEKFVSIINAFAMIGIALGVATLIIVMSVMNGYEKTLFTKILGFKGHLTITTHDTKIQNWHEMKQNIQQKVHGITAIAPVIENQALAMSENGTSGVMIKGIEYEDLNQKMVLSDGFISLNNECKGIILGSSLNRNLQSNKIKIVLPKFNETMIGAMPRMKSYNVCGEFDIGMYEYNSGIIFMDLKDAQLLFGLKESVTGIEISLQDSRDLLKIKQELIMLLRENSFSNDNLVIVDWQEANKTLMTGLQVERTVMFLILSLIILIAAFNIISSLMLLVHDKMKEIAILRTIGMTKTSIMKIFMISGSLVGVIGTVVGSILGILFSLNIESVRGFLEGLSGVKLFDPVIYFLTILPSDVNNEQVISVIVTSLILSFVATVYPALRVSRMSPAEILKA